VTEAGILRGQILRPALFSLLQDGPDEVAYGDRSTPGQAEPWLDRFERRVDETFFPDLWREAAAPEDEHEALRRQWLRTLAGVALGLLDEAGRSVPQAAMRRYRAKVRARGMFFSLLHKHFQDLKDEDADDRAARLDA
jgi:CRISPR system Cascade subunit CasA